MRCTEEVEHGGSQAMRRESRCKTRSRKATAVQQMQLMDYLSVVDTTSSGW